MSEQILQPIGITCSAWKVCTGPAAGRQLHLEEISDHFASESLLEGIPLTGVATVWLSAVSTSCRFASCRASSIVQSFPPYGKSLPASPRDLTPAEVVAAQHGTCTALPLTSDGWFTIGLHNANIEPYVPARKAQYLDRHIGFHLNGASLNLGISTGCCICFSDA